jgi:protein TonB
MEARTLEQSPWTGASGQDRFGRALLVAAVIEVVLLMAFMRAPRPAMVVRPSVVKLQMIQPAPVPKAPPAPPKPPLPKPPPPVPVTPVPVTPPVPKPLPAVRRAPAAHSHPRPVVHTPPPPPMPTPVTPSPLPPAPVMQAPVPSPAVAATALARYTGMVRDIVLSHVVVPAQIEESGLSGTCVLEFVLAPDGTLQSVSVATSSGLHAVDQAALDAIRASGFPAFLPDMPGHALTFTLPVHVSAGDE